MNIARQHGSRLKRKTNDPLVQNQDGDPGSDRVDYQEEIMKAGRELDALVAEKVMGWEKFSIHDEGASPEWTALMRSRGYTWMWKQKECCKWDEIQSCPPYSTDVKAAWEVVEKINGHRLIIIPLFSSDADEWESWRVELDREETCARTFPLAICLAALKSVGS